MHSPPFANCGTDGAAPFDMPHLELCGLTKRYGASTSVDAIDFAVERGEFICLLGPSGCGKTTTLRLLAGFLIPDAGEIRVAGKVISSPDAVTQPERRNMGMIFQSYAIWPHMTVRENVGYGLKMQSMPASQRDARTRALLDATRLVELADRYPAELSGGQQQRIALARALAPNPGILLLDEPLSNLDANLRGEMRFEIRRLHDEYRNTSIYVTHDQVEAMTMADRIVVMNGGRIEQIGTPQDVYDRPRSRFVARFIGASNILDGTHQHGNRVDVAGHVLEVEHGEFAGAGKPMSVCVKTHDIELRADERVYGANVLPGIVRSQAYLGSHRDFIVDVGLEILIAAPASLDLPVGSKVSVRLPADRCRGIIR
jgi:iron(III) transport system ATP-binding protein